MCITYKETGLEFLSILPNVNEVKFRLQNGANFRGIKYAKLVKLQK